MQQDLEQASAAIDDAVKAYAGQITVMRQQLAAKQAEAASMAAALTQHETHYSAISTLRPAADQPAPAPSAIPVALVGDAPAAPSPSSGQTPPPILARLAEAMAQMTPPGVPYPTTPPGV